MSIERKDVEHVAELARLDLTEDETQLYTDQLKRILGYVEKLSEVDTTGVEPTSFTVPLRSVMREDVAGESLKHDKAMENAPDTVRGLFRVPKVIE